MGVDRDGSQLLFQASLLSSRLELRWKSLSPQLEREKKEEIPGMSRQLLPFFLPGAIFETFFLNKLKKMPNSYF